MRRRHYVLMTCVGLLLVAGVGVGCLSLAPRAVDTSHLRGPYHLEDYRDGQKVNERQLAAGSAAERAVADWLAAHRDGWSPSLVSYAPKRVIRGDGFNINLLPDGLCVLNYDLSDKPRQVVRTVSPQEIESLVTAIGGE